MKYKVELRDKEGVRINVENILDFNDDNKDESHIEFTAQEAAYLYQILFYNADITVEVLHFNSISGTWMILYSYYHTEKRFVKH